MKTFLVGGAVRDKLLGFPWHESDWVVVGGSPAELEAKGFVPVGKDFPVFLHPETKEEYALARTERKTGHGYKGFDFYCSPDVSLEEDLRRRDLTINAIAEDSQGTLIDPYHGKDDIEQGVLRHVSEAFAEDPVRILRLARFHARYAHLGFTIAPETQSLLEAMVAAGEVDHLVAERVWKEFSRALEERQPWTFISTLQNCGALERLIPELNQVLLSNVHLFDLVTRACAESQDSDIRFAVMFHQIPCEDIGPCCERLAVPRDKRDLTLALSRFGSAYEQAEQLDAESLLNCLQGLDVFRRAERFEQFLQAGEIISPAGGGRKVLSDALASCQAIDLKAIASAGFKGKAFGLELQRQRLERLEALINSRNTHT